jgi:hypothetical protein
MRDKEALDNERKNLMRNVDKQAKVVEKLLASEKSLQSQVVGVLHVGIRLSCLLFDFRATGTGLSISPRRLKVPLWSS